jgi:hypothetical protein
MKSQPHNSSVPVSKEQFHMERTQVTELIALSVSHGLSNSYFCNLGLLLPLSKIENRKNFFKGQAKEAVEL